jgi:hypothetical protein
MTHDAMYLSLSHLSACHHPQSDCEDPERNGARDPLQFGSLHYNESPRRSQSTVCELYGCYKRVRCACITSNRKSTERVETRGLYARPHAPARRPTLGARAESRRPDDASGLTCKEELQARAETPDYTSPESASNARCTSYGLTHADAYLCLMYSLAMTCQLCLRPIALSEMRCWQ